MQQSSDDAGLSYRSGHRWASLVPWMGLEERGRRIDERTLLTRLVGPDLLPKAQRARTARNMTTTASRPS
jgi:hypothetical protein